MKKPKKVEPLYGPLGTVARDEWPMYAKAWAGKSGHERSFAVRMAYPEVPVMIAADRRIRALDSLWVFLTEVLKNPVVYEPLHKPLCEWFHPDQWTTQKKMLLMARGHVKSNAFNVGQVLWRLCRDPNERVLIASHRNEDAAKFVSSIANIVTQNETFRETFPDIRPALGPNGRSRRWSDWRILIERDIDYIEPSVQGTTPQKSASGQHYSFYVPDDIVTHLNVKSEVQLERTRAFKEQCESLLDPGAREAMLGTRYHFEDEYGRILDTPNLRRAYDCKIIPATKTPGIVDEYVSGRIEWKREDDFEHLHYPSRFTLAPEDYICVNFAGVGDHSKNRKSLPQVKLLQGTLTYANQYDLVPRDPATQPFDVNKIEIVDALPRLAPNQHYDWYQFCDHASERHTQSKTALGTVAIGPRMQCYLVDLFWGTYSTAQVCEEMFRWQQMDEDMRPKIVGMGRSAYELQIEQYCRERSKELGIGIPFQFVKTVEHLEDKNDHIRRLVPFVERRKLSILATCRNRQQAIHEFDWFPKSKQKDVVDMLANIAKIALPGREREFLDEAKEVKPEPKPTGMTMDDAIRELERGGSVRMGKKPWGRTPGVVRFGRR